MMNYDVIVIGGSAAGIPAAITSRRHYPSKSVLLVRKENKVQIPCGIPYIFGTVGTPDKNMIPDQILTKNDINLLIDEVKSIDRNSKTIETVVEVGRPKVLKRSRRIISVSITARNMVINSGIIKN